MTSIIKTGLAALAIMFTAVTAAFAGTPEVFVAKKWDYAVDGYDVTSYFDGALVKGDSQFAAEVANATFIFASQENLDKFLASPDAYRPAFGGHCAYALAVRGILVKGDPQIWHIEDGVLYLNLNKGVQKKWLADIANMIAKAQAFWPGVLN